MSKKDLIAGIDSLLDKMDTDSVEHLYNYVVNYHETQLNMEEKENHAVAQLGYNPTLTMPDHEWEAMLKRNEMSLEKENKK